MFESSVIRRIFGVRRDEVTGVWRKLNKDEFRTFILSTKLYYDNQIEDAWGM
jgi:hypothetical protein